MTAVSVGSLTQCWLGRDYGAGDGPDGHALTTAVEHALTALAKLSAAVAACADTRTVRDVARITGLPRQTVHRWKTEPPGQARLQTVRDALHDAGCG